MSAKGQRQQANKTREAGSCWWGDREENNRIKRHGGRVLIGIWPCALHTGDKGAAGVFKRQVYTTALPRPHDLTVSGFRRTRGLLGPPQPAVRGPGARPQTHPEVPAVETSLQVTVAESTIRRLPSIGLRREERSVRRR